MRSERLYPVRVTEAALAVISAGLEGLPYRVAAPVIAEINRQVNSESPCEGCKYRAGADARQGCASPALPGIPTSIHPDLPEIARAHGVCVMRQSAQA